MDWLEHALQAHPFISGAIVCVVVFGILRIVRSRPVRIENCMLICGLFSSQIILEVWRHWPQTLVQSAFLVGIPLICFLFSFMLVRLDPITFDRASRRFIRERTVLGRALCAVFFGAVTVFTPFYSNALGGGDPIAVVVWAWLAGSALGQWLQINRAQWA